MVWTAIREWQTASVFAINSGNKGSYSKKRGALAEIAENNGFIPLEIGVLLLETVE
ncbi:MAG: hypothetical protein ACQEXQ_20310 [Bacillota bacterium]